MRSIILSLILIGLAHGVIPDAPVVPRGTTVFPCAMTRYSTPLKLGWVVGVSLNRPVGSSCYHGPFFQLEPGFGGGKINLGYRCGEYNFVPIYSIGVSGSILRTWGNPLGDVEPDQTYVGGELSVALVILGFNAGAFRHISGDDTDHEWIMTLGVGAGF
jgi:hypothetical protein